MTYQQNVASNSYSTCPRLLLWCYHITITWSYTAIPNMAAMKVWKSSTWDCCLAMDSCSLAQSSNGLFWFCSWLRAAFYGIYLGVSPCLLSHASYRRLVFNSKQDLSLPFLLCFVGHVSWQMIKNITWLSCLGYVWDINWSNLKDVEHNNNIKRGHILNKKYKNRRAWSRLSWTSCRCTLLFGNRR